MNLILEFFLFKNLPETSLGPRYFTSSPLIKMFLDYASTFDSFYSGSMDLLILRRNVIQKMFFTKFQQYKSLKNGRKHNFTIYKTVFTIFNAILFDTKPTSFHFIPIQNKKAEADYLNDRMSKHLIDRKIKALLLL